MVNDVIYKMWLVGMFLLKIVVFFGEWKFFLVKSLIKLCVKKFLGFEFVNIVKMIWFYIEFYFYCMYYLLGELKIK